MKCEFCDGRTESRRVRKQHLLDGRLFIVEGVVAEVCRACGERYFSAEELDRVDGVLRGEHEVKENLSVEVVDVRGMSA